MELDWRKERRCLSYPVKKNGVFGHLRRNLLERTNRGQHSQHHSERNESCNFALRVLKNTRCKKLHGSFLTPHKKGFLRYFFFPVQMVIESAPFDVIRSSEGL